MQGIDLVARQSILSMTMRRSTVSALHIKELLNPNCDERIWDLRNLKNRFSAKNLEDLYKRYEQRSLISYFATYLSLEMFLTLMYIIWLVITCSIEKSILWSDDPYIFDITCRCLILFCVLLPLRLFTIYKEDVFKEKPRLLYYLAIVVILVIEILDLSLIGLTTIHDMREHNNSDGLFNHTYSYNTPDWPRHSNFISRYSDLSASKVPVGSLYNIIVIYMFLPIARKDLAVSCGIFVSVLTITMSTTCNVMLDLEFLKWLMNNHLETQGPPPRGTEGLSKTVSADIVFHICLNLLGFYIRYVRDISMRRGFLDKRGCIETTFRLKTEKDQEEHLLLSIIPKHIATQVREGIWQFLEKLKTETKEKNRKPFNELFIERHENVSILFADICNFTPLTTTLSAAKLVDTLNDLFGKFDDAAETHNCMRIKILGDCYYCVSGVPTADDNHAKNTVEMGLEMIGLIKEVRDEHHVPVNMRIGIHTGFILSGLIGLRKWQYDIWSNDVTIAEHMEGSGKPGKVHITEKTKSFLEDDAYKYEEVYKVDDHVIQESKLKTYLIVPTVTVSELMKRDSSRKDKKVTIDPDFTKVNTYDGQRVDFIQQPRRGSLVGGTATKLKSRRLSLRKDSLWSNDSDTKLNTQRRKSVLMDSSLKSFKKMMDNAEGHMKEQIEELPLTMKDRWCGNKEIRPLLLIFRDKSWEKPHLNEHDPLFKYYILSSFVILNGMGIIMLIKEGRRHVVLWSVYTVLFVILAFLLPCLWVSYIWDQIIDPQFDLEVIEEPENRLIKMFYRASRKINTGIFKRYVVFVVVAALILSSAVVDIANEPCLAESPRFYTYRCALALMLVFTFKGINHWWKVAVSFAFLSTYFAIIILNGHPPSRQLFERQNFGYDHLLFSEDKHGYSHFLYLCVCFILFYVMDRQHEYISRLDYQWKRKLKSEQEQASSTKLVNKTLLQNILPQHVAETYLSANREPGKLFCEEYDNVAVMFASLPNYLNFYTEQEIRGTGDAPLRVLNQIIAGFDKLLFEAQFTRVEKIKIIGSTLMACCGLQPGKRDSIDSSTDPFSKGANSRTMVKFAAAMMRELKAIDYNTLGLTNTPDFQLRVGIQAGSVIAGVVGAQKPLYDIWGDTVNVASRMDKFGERGRIQVSEETAKALDSERICCSYRDIVNVKGKGLMTTYFVDLNDDLEVVEREYGEEDWPLYENVGEHQNNVIGTDSEDTESYINFDQNALVKFSFSSSSSSCGSTEASSVIMAPDSNKVNKKLSNCLLPTEDRRRSESDILEAGDIVSHVRRKSSSSGILYASTEEIKQALSSSGELDVQSKVQKMSSMEDRSNRFSRSSNQSGTTISSNNTVVYNGPGPSEVTVAFVEELDDSEEEPVEEINSVGEGEESLAVYDNGYPEFDEAIMFDKDGVKKDSGYGSQGLLRGMAGVEKYQVHVDVHNMEDDSEEALTVPGKTRLRQIPREKLKDLYDKHPHVYDDQQEETCI